MRKFPRPNHSSLIVGIPQIGSMPEVYAHVGRTLHAAQMFEGVVVNTLVWCALDRKRRLLPEEVEQVFSDEDGRTLGTVLMRLRKRAAVPKDLDDRLSRALKRRNELAHGFFRRNLARTLSRSGQDEIIEELVEWQRFFECVAYELLAASQPLRQATLAAQVEAETNALLDRRPDV